MGQEFDTDQGYGGAGALGLIVLATDESIEPEIGPLIRAAGKTLYHSRIPNLPHVTRETLLRMEADLPAAAGLLPSSVSFAAIGYGCTSAATVIGTDRVAAAIRQAHPGVPVSEPISAVLAACQALRVKRLGFVTPYVAEVSAAMRALLEQNGLQVTAFASFEQVDDRVVARISEASVLRAVTSVAGSACDAVFVSCTNLRTFNVIEEAEARIGKPVISSNSALAWHMLRLAGVKGPLQGPGQIFSL